jgi:excisionase family DNA binding protein
MLRPAEAARQFGVSRRTLHRWAMAGRIGRARDGARMTWYVAADIEAVIAAGLSPRTVVPIRTTLPPVPDQSWRNAPLWKGVTG